MGVIFSRFRAKPSTKELLEDLQKEIDALEEYKRSTEVQQKAIVGSLVFYSVLLYIIVACVFLFYSYPITTKERIIYAIPFVIFPFFTTNTILKGSFGEMELRRRNVSPRGTSPSPLGTPGQTLTINASAGAPNSLQFFTGKSPTNPLYPTAFFPRGGQHFVRPPAPPMPRPVLPRERTFMDRLVDYLVGDGPSNRYALICRQCQSHNGMALKEEFEYRWCCYCFHFNPPRSQQPPPPRLTLPAPPPSAPPAITDGPSSEAASSSSDETEIESVSDVDSSISKNEDKADTSETKDSSNHRLSVSSESEIQANLVEDQPYSTRAESEPDIHKILNSEESS
ncbi:Endoplasmic reticulum junction formation like protein [Argiope bruennichi]|uniref:Endoplasmic reticulum junction formation protein lunapark n=1 Tax=Argiope bruennichi TaxID=94029 RepID=A0A8T0G4J5_ARGBR|nr:Endoplasmic reticulum junction formation like protein [Argiope bruennichi]